MRNSAAIFSALVLLLAACGKKEQPEPYIPPPASTSTSEVDARKAELPEQLSAIEVIQLSSKIPEATNAFNLAVQGKITQKELDRIMLAIHKNGAVNPQIWSTTRDPDIFVGDQIFRASDDVGLWFLTNEGIKSYATLIVVNCTKNTNYMAAEVEFRERDGKGGTTRPVKLFDIDTDGNKEEEIQPENIIGSNAKRHCQRP